MIKLNDKLKLSVSNYGKISLAVSVLTLICILFLNGKIVRVEKYHTVSEKEVVVTVSKEEFSEERFKEYLLDINIRYPDVVFAQAYLETGGFKSEIFKVNNNLFGMKVASKRPTTALMLDRNHAVYSDWKKSVLDYALYQSYYLRKIKNKEEYIKTIGRIYAEDPNYLRKVKTIINE